MGFVVVCMYAQVRVLPKVTQTFEKALLHTFACLVLRFFQAKTVRSRRKALEVFLFKFYIVTIEAAAVDAEPLQARVCKEAKRTGGNVT